MPWVLPRPHKLFLLGFETAIWHVRSATSCFYWVSKLLSGTFSAPLKSLKTLKTLAAAFDGLSLLCHGTPEAPRAVSVGLRKCYLTLPRRHELFLLGFETAIWHAAAFDGHSLLCHGSSRGPTSCFCWASKLLSGPSEAPQDVSIGLRNCYLARFQHPLKAKPSKPSQQLSTAFRCFAMGPPEAPRAVSVGLRNCYLALPRRDKLFLLGFETAIWHVAAFDGLSLLCHGSSRGPTSCFCWASKLLSGTSEAPQAVSILGFETAIWHLFSTLKSLKTLKTLPAAFDGLSLLCHGSSRGPTSCFCWASKLLSDTSEAPQAVSIGLRNCYLARFQHPLKASKPSKPSKPRSSFRRPFAALPWDLRGATSCFYWASKMLSGTLQLSTAIRCFAMGHPEAPRAVSVWHFRGATSCFYWASKLLSGTLQLSTAIRCFAMGPPEAHKLFLLGFETAIWHVAAFDGLRCFAMGPPEALRAVSVGLRNCYLALPRRDKLFLLGFETAIWHVAAFDGLSLLCHGSSRGPTSCFCWASKLLSGTSEAPQAVSIGLRNCYLAHFPHPLKPSKASKPSQQLSTAFCCFAIGFRNCYLARFQHP